MNQTQIESVIFDLDGVITNSTPLHSSAWKIMFDSFLRNHAEETDTPFHEFTHQEDYLAYVDGKPRYQGVKSFLESRGINLPYGNPEDPPDQRTICGLGNFKNELYNHLLEEEGVEIYATTVELIHQLRAVGIPLGLASSSKNAQKVLELTGLTDLFQTVVDGVVSAELDLRGKPAPDIFQTACRNLNASPERAVIIEDANSGVQAGFRGGFGLVIGVAREENQLELELHGADIVVEDLLEIDLAKINNWFSEGYQKKQWFIEYHEYDPEKEATREALCTIGNGFFGTRGAFEEIPAVLDIHYPGTYITGLYNCLESNIAGRTITNEDLVNIPNWLPVTFKINTGEWFNPQEVDILEFSRKLDFLSGTLYRRMVVRNDQGHQTMIQSWRLASMADPHLAVLRYEITPLNYARTFTVRSELDGTITNQGVKRYRELSSRHLEPLLETGSGSQTTLAVITNQSRITIAESSRLRVLVGEEEVHPDFKIGTNPGKVSTTFEIEARSDRPLTVEKTVAIYASHLTDGEDPIQLAEKKIEESGTYAQLQTQSLMAWKKIWDRIDVQVSGDRLVQKMIRLHLYHTMVSVSPHSKDYATGIPARGLHGEAYRGHIFWDELYVMPFLNFNFPDTARSALLYRHQRLPAARRLARKEGVSGAMFPWQSGSSGREESQLLHLNPRSGKWGPDHSHLQRHVSLAIAYNLWQYLWISDDREFLAEAGAELFLEICLFWSSMAICPPESDRCSIERVMGPDEFHEHYPDSENGGLKNNAYTNLMVVWLFNRAFDLLSLLPENRKTTLLSELEIRPEELERWKYLSHNLTVPISEEGILEQFEGYFDLKELDWDHYNKKYDDIHRMDRILKAEGHSPNEYKVAKQADALMLFYNLPEGQVVELLNQLRYTPPENLLERNFHYYLQRTSHGSTLSRLVHAYLADLVGNYALSRKLYREALQSDYIDIQGGTTQEGIHLGVMTGTALFAIRTYAGLNWIGEKLSLNPHLPEGWKKIKFNIDFRGCRYFFNIKHNKVNIKLVGNQPGSIYLLGQEYQLNPGEWKKIKINHMPVNTRDLE